MHFILKSNKKYSSILVRGVLAHASYKFKVCTQEVNCLLNKILMLDYKMEAGDLTNKQILLKRTLCKTLKKHILLFYFISSCPQEGGLLLHH